MDKDLQTAEPTAQTTTVANPGETQTDGGTVEGAAETTADEGDE